MTKDQHDLQPTLIRNLKAISAQTLTLWHLPTPQIEYLKSKALKNEFFVLELGIRSVHIGGCSILIRQESTEGTARPIALVSHVMIAPEFRGKGFLYELFRAVDDFLDTRCLDAIVVARRGVEGMYPKFGFSAFGTFTEYVSHSKYPRHDFRPQTLSNKDDWSEIINLHQETYSQIYPFLLREDSEWQLIRDKYFSHTIEIFLHKHLGRVTGYFITLQDKIIEIATDSNGSPEFLKSLRPEMPLRIQQSHPLIREYPLCFRLREFRPVLRGGHLRRYTRGRFPDLQAFAHQLPSEGGFTADDGLLVKPKWAPGESLGTFVTQLDQF